MTQQSDPTKSEVSRKGAIPVFITRIAPFFLPALFFQSAVFAFISPLPLFILTLKNHLWVGLLALAANASFLYSLGSANRLGAEFNVAIAFWVLIGILFPFLIRKFGRIQKSFVVTFLIFIAFIMGSLFYFSNQAKLPPVDYLRAEISLGLDHMAALPDSPVQKLIEEKGRDEIIRQLLTELPSGLLISVILAFWINLLFASQLLGGFLSRAFWSTYRNPEWLVIPTLICAGLFAFTQHVPHLIGLNGMKVFLVFYGFQGLSVISALLTRYQVGGFGRAILFSVALFLAMPFVLALGFFDLWFDFRRKFAKN